MGDGIKKFIAREWIALVVFFIVTFILWRVFRQPATFFRPEDTTWIDRTFYALNTRGLLGVAYGVLSYGIYLILRVTMSAGRTLKRKQS